MEPVLYECCKEKENEELRIEKTIKSTNCMFKGTYFTITTIVGTIMLQKSTFLPRILFPVSKDTFQENMYYNYPLMPYGENIRVFFLISLGYHFLKTVE